MTRPSDEVYCHVKECEQLATTVCEHCGRPCCHTHVRHFSITYRDDQRAPGMSATARLPIRTETYLLCPRCSTKPVPRRTHLPPR